LFLPTAIGGDAARIEHVSRHGEIQRSEATAVVVWERASGLLAMVIFLIVGILVVPSLLDEGSLLVGTSIVVSVGIILLLVILSRSGKSGKSPEWWSSFTSTLGGIRNPRKFGELVFWSLIAQASTISIPFIFGLLATGGNLNTALLLATITPIIWLITMLPLSLGGNGLREMSYVGIGELVGIDPVISLSASLGLTFSNLITSVLGIFAFHQWSGRLANSSESEE